MIEIGQPLPKGGIAGNLVSMAMDKNCVFAVIRVYLKEFSLGYLLTTTDIMAYNAIVIVKPYQFREEVL